MDEATAAADEASDAAIAATLRQPPFAAATVVAIAHRLGTVIDSDRVMVMDQGRVAELGPPWELLQRRGGALSRLVAAAGPAAEAALRSAAERAAAGRAAGEEEGEGQAKGGAAG